MSVDNRTFHNDCEDDAQTFTTSGGQLGTESTETGLIFQGSASVDVQHSDNNDRTTTTGDSAGSAAWAPLDMSDMTIYVVVKDNLIDTFAAAVGGNGGHQIVIGDGTDLIGYPVGGSDARGIPVRRQFNTFKLDVSAVVASAPGNEAVYSGTEAALDQTIIDEIGYGSLHSSKAVGANPNLWIDGIYYVANDTYCLTINGGTVGTPETMADVVGDDETNGWGMVGNPLASQYQFIAPTEWGESAAAADHYFTATDEQWYWLGDNSGGHAVGATHFPFRVVGNATDTGSFVLTRVVIVNTGTRAQFDLSSTNMDTMTFDGCVFTDLGAMTLQVQDIGSKFFIACVWNNCDQVDVQSMDMDDCIFNGSTNADGAILLDEEASTTTGTLTNIEFNSDGTGHAIHLRPTGAGPFEYDLDNLTYNDYATDGGTAGNRVIYINPVTSTVDITLNIQNGGDTPSVDTTGYTGTLSIVNAVTIRVEGLTEGAACKCIANETIGTLTIGDVIFELLADANGVAEITTFNYEAAFGAGLDVIIRAAQQGLPNAAIQDDNGVFTDFTTAANSTTTDDMVLYPTVPVATEDSFLFAHSEQFPRVKVELGTVGTGGFTITWEYWNGAWVALSGVTDGTSNFTATGEQIVSWTLPGDWATTTINSQGPFYYVRARYTAGTMTIVPLGRKAQLDVTRYLIVEVDRTVTGSGLTTTPTWAQDTISKFSPTD